MTTKIPLQDNLIIDKTFNFAVRILNFSQHLQELKHYILANQLQRSGTSIGANSREAQIQRVKPILSTNLKFLQRRPMKQNISYFCQKR